MKYTTSEAAKKLARLLKKASAGEDVVIAWRQVRVKLVPVRELPKLDKNDRISGRLKGRIYCAPDAFAPPTDLELLKLGIRVTEKYAVRHREFPNRC